MAAQFAIADTRRSYSSYNVKSSPDDIKVTKGTPKCFDDTKVRSLRCGSLISHASSRSMTLLGRIAD